jgi:fumarate hydratase class II
LESITLVGNVSTLLAQRCVIGIQANAERCLKLAESSPSIVTPLNRIIGYEAAAAIAKHSVKADLTIAEATRDLGYVARGEISEEQLALALDVTAMTGRR